MNSMLEVADLSVLSKAIKAMSFRLFLLSRARVVQINNLFAKIFFGGLETSFRNRRLEISGIRKFGMWDLFLISCCYLCVSFSQSFLIVLDFL